jgi:hypothetical protein
MVGVLSIDNRALGQAAAASVGLLYLKHAYPTDARLYERARANLGIRAQEGAVDKRHPTRPDAKADRRSKASQCL